MMKQIAAAFVKAQRGFAPALKTSINPHFKKKYADLGACIDAVIDALNAEGIALLQRTHECETGVIVETVFIHESGEMLECGRLQVPAQKNDPQGYGSSLTYARRYSLMAACGIAPEDDDGNAGSAPAPAKKQSVPSEVFRPFFAAIQAATTGKELQAAYIAAEAAAAGDSEALDYFIAAVESRKTELRAKSSASQA